MRATVESAVQGDSRNLAEAIAHALHAAGVADEAQDFVEDLLAAPLNEAAARSMAKYREYVPGVGEGVTAALVEALLAARTHEGWLALMASRSETEKPLDVRVGDGGILESIVDPARREIGLHIRVNRQDLRLWVPFSALALIVHDAVGRFARDEINRVAERRTAL